MGAAPQSRIGVVTWNVHKCVGGLDRRYDPERIVAWLDDAGRKDASLAFTAGPERQVAYRGKMLLSRLARCRKAMDAAASLLFSGSEEFAGLVRMIREIDEGR